MGTSKTMHFDEFIKFILYRSKFNSHWNTYESLCHPCSMKFDFIIRLETMERDMELLSDKLGKDLSKYYTKTYNSARYPTNKTVDRHIHEMSKVDDVTYKKLLDRGYAKDMRLFGYRFDRDQGMAYCGKHCC